MLNQNHRKSVTGKLRGGLFRPEFKGERHIPLRIKGKWKLAEYCGPGTHVVERVRRGDRGLDYTDNVCMMHDLAYQTIGTSNLPVDEKTRLARIADKSMIENLEGVKGWNAKLARTGIKAKNLAEDMGLLSKKRYITDREQ